MLLRTFQRLSRVAELERSGELVGDWDRVPATLRDAYRAMVAARADVQVDTHGRPPIWAWRGHPRLLDAALLLDEEYELSTGYATVEFEAPTNLVVVSDYGVWNDYLAALLDGRPSRWQIAPTGRSGDPPGGSGPEQACVPYLRADWVREVRPLPTTGWAELDRSRPA